MARRKTSSTPTGDPAPRFEDAVEELTAQVQQLTGETKVLREAIDDLRTEVEWLARNLLQSRWPPAPPPAPPAHQEVKAELPTPKPAVEEADDEPVAAPSQRTLFD